MQSESEFSVTTAKVFVGALVGCAIAMLLALAPGRDFWALAGVAVIFTSLVVALLMELLNKSGT